MKKMPGPKTALPRFRTSVIAAILFSVLALNAAAKDYYFPRVKVTVQIEKDGSFLLTEERTYRFSGEFHWASYNLSKSGFSGLHDFSVADENGPYELIPSDTGKPGTFVLTETSNAWSARFNYHAADTDKTFTFKFRITGAVRAYEDTADFYWKLVGTGWEKRTELLEGFIFLPAEVKPELLYVFGHGPLQGSVERIGGRGAQYRLTRLPAKTFVEARLLFPADILEMPREGRAALDRLLAEERGLARKTEAKRMRNKFITWILAAVPVAIFVFWLFLFFKHGKEHRPSQEIVYFREIPEDLPPAVVGYLMRFKRVTPADFTATIMSLIRKGHISLETREEEKGIIFKRTVSVLYLSGTGKGAETLLPHEKIVYDFLFSKVSYEDVLAAYPGKTAAFARRLIKGKTGILPDLAGTESDTVSSDDIKKFIKKNPREFRAIFETFTKLAKKEGEGRRFFDKKAERWMAVFGIVAVVIPVIGLILAANAGLIFFVPVYVACLLIFIFLIFPLTRRTREGAESYAKWKGLKRFLKDFSDMKTAPPASIAIWEYYLIYAVTFGISKKVIKQMKLALPQYSQDEVMKSNFFAASFAGGRTFDFAAVETLSSFVDNMVNSFNSISTAASTGGGGGFSGGGGGGGGGSGGGAG